MTYNYFSFLGYHVSFEVFDSRPAACPPEFMNIPVPKGDPVFDPAATGKVLLPFHRGVWDKESGQSPSNPRTQVMIIDSYQTVNVKLPFRQSHYTMLNIIFLSLSALMWGKQI